jgi:hypothetical protein
VELKTELPNYFKVFGFSFQINYVSSNGNHGNKVYPVLKIVGKPRLLTKQVGEGSVIMC